MYALNEGWLSCARRGQADLQFINNSEAGVGVKEDFDMFFQPASLKRSTNLKSQSKI